MLHQLDRPVPPPAPVSGFPGTFEAVSGGIGPGPVGGQDLDHGKLRGVEPAGRSRFAAGLSPGSPVLPQRANGSAGKIGS
jgi:hypothetical protein